MTPAYLEQLRGDDDGLVEKFQWAGRMLLKSTAIFRYSELVISSAVWAILEVKDLEERYTLHQNEKLDLKKAK